MERTPSSIKRVIGSRVKGLDALELIPVVDMSEAASRAYAAMERGLIPERYGWTKEKTAYAYGLKSYRRWARSIIVAAKYYYTDEEVPKNEAFGRIARFTWRNNYRYLAVRLREAVEALQEALGSPIRFKALSNYTSVPEKPLFRLSGIADVGKHSVLIHPRMGSLFTVGEAVTDLEVDFGAAGEDTGFMQAFGEGAGIPGSGPPAAHAVKPPDFHFCGGCRLCMDACPTGAIPQEGIVNVNRCFQYLSENLLLIPESDREKWGSRVYGCSTCIDACPYNERLEPWGEKHGFGFVGPGLNLLTLLELGEPAWRELFKQNQIGIRDRRAIQKNVILSLGWLEYRKAVEPLIPFLEHDHEVIRTCAAWALGRIGTVKGKQALERRIRAEQSLIVLKEIARFL